MWPDVSVFATARKLPTLIYRSLRRCQPYVDKAQPPTKIAIFSSASEA